MNWEKFVKRYIWDDDRTPYLTAARRLSRHQADYEIFAYAVFLVVLFGLAALAALLNATASLALELVALYAFSIAAVAVVLAMTKHVHAALYCASAPPAALLYFFVFGFHPDLAWIDHVVLIVFGVLWLRYALRIVTIARTYPAMPDRHPNP